MHTHVWQYTTKYRTAQLTVIHAKPRFRAMSPPAKQFGHVAIRVTFVYEDAGDRTGTGVQVLHINNITGL